MDPILAEVGAKILNEEFRPAVGPSQAQQPLNVAAAKALTKEVAAGTDLDLKQLRRSMLQDPVSSMQQAKPETESVSGATAKSLPKSKPRFVIPMSPDLMAPVIKILAEKGFIKDGVLRTGSLRVDPSTVVAYLIEVMLRYSMPRGDASLSRRKNSIGGLSYESMIPYQPEVVDAETKVALSNVKKVIRSRTPAGASEGKIQDEIKSAQKMILERMAGPASVADKAPPPVSTPDAVAIMENGPVGDNLWLIRLTGVRDMDGQLVTDHFRALVSFEGNTVKLIPVGIGESKFQSGYNVIIDQLIESFKRVRDGVSATNLLPSANVEVQWGPDVIAIIQSEEAPPEGHFNRIEQRLADAAGSKKLNVNLVYMGNEQAAEDARKMVLTIIEKLKKSM